MTSLISVTAGDPLALATAACGTLTAALQTAAALAQDQSPEGRAAAKIAVEILAPLLALITFVNGKLGIDPLKAEQKTAS